MITEGKGEEERITGAPPPTRAAEDRVKRVDKQNTREFHSVKELVH